MVKSSSHAFDELVKEFVAKNKSHKEENERDSGWWGSTGTTNGAVTRIEVNNSSIAGLIGDHLCEYNAMEELSFYYRNGTAAAAIPFDKVCEVQSLTKLSIDFGRAQGNLTIPPALKKLQNLRELTIKFLNIESGVEHIAELSALRSLCIESTNIASVPITFRNLQKLEKVSIKDANLSAFPSVLTEIESLVTLDLENNKITGALPPKLSGLRRLKILTLSGNKFTTGLEHVASLDALKTLEANGNDFSGPLPPELGKLRNLTVLSLDANAFSGCAPAWLGGLPKLETLSLSSNLLTGVEPGALNGAVLRGVDLSANKLTEIPLTSLLAVGKPRRFEVFLDLRDNPIPSGPLPFQYLPEIKPSRIKLTGYIQGFSLSPIVYFLERVGNRTGEQTVVDFTTWPFASSGGSPDWTDKSAYEAFPQLILQCPEAALREGRRFAYTVNKTYPALRVFLQKLCEAQNPSVLDAVIRLWCTLTRGAKLQPIDEDVLLSYAEDVAGIAHQMLRCSALDDPSTFYRFVLPKKYLVAGKSRVTMEGVLWGAMHVFEGGFPIRRCMDHQFKAVLASPAVLKIMEFLFYANIEIGNRVFVNERHVITEEDMGLNFGFTIALNGWKISCQRYTPAVLFFLEGLGKVVTLLLVTIATIVVYGKQGHNRFANSVAEGFLLLMLTTQICYEVGQLSTAQWNLRKYFSDFWNALDFVGLLLIGLWALLSSSPTTFDGARALLCLSAIPLSLQLLQYISLFKTIGLLVLMIKSMVLDVMVFVLVYVVSIFGFGVCFNGLFYGQSSFESSGDTLLYLFQSTLGNFDFGALSGSPFSGVGTAVLVAFLVLTSVLLVNLLIAQMSSTYNRIKDKSREEWAYVMASTVQEYILLRERSPLCMLPPPLNAVTTLLAPVHYWAMPRYKVSVAGTAADYVLGIALVPLHMVHNWAVTAQRLCGRSEYQNLYRSERPLFIVYRIVDLFVGPLIVTVQALVRFYYRTVHVSPAPRSEEGGGNWREYNIWYFVRGQQDEFNEANPLPQNKGGSVNDQASSGAKSTEMSTLTLTVNALQQGTDFASRAKAASPAKPGATHDPLPSNGDAENVVLFTKDDIHRIFYTGAHSVHGQEGDAKEQRVAFPAEQTPRVLWSWRISFRACALRSKR